MSGIIGIIGINGNGFYPNDNDSKYLIENIEQVKPDEIIYPFCISIIAHNIQDNIDFIQHIKVNNINQLKYIRNRCSRYGNFYPTSFINNKGVDLPFDYICNSNILSEMKNM